MSHRNLPELIETRTAESGSDVAILDLAGSKPVATSWDELIKQARQLAAGLHHLGVRAGDRCLLIAPNTPRWPLADLAILLAGAVSCPLSALCLPEQVAGLARPLEPTAAFVHSPACADALSASLPHLHLITLDHSPDSSPDAPLSLDALRELGATHLASTPDLLHRIRTRLSPDDEATIIHTSGRAGTPRPCCFSHATVLDRIDANHRALDLSPRDIQLLIPPLAHVFGRVLFLTALRAGASTAFPESEERIPADLLTVRPTIIASAPRLFEEVYARAIAAAPLPLGATMAQAIVRESEAIDSGEHLPPFARLTAAAARKLLAPRATRSLGDRLRLAISASDALSPTVAHFFRGAGIPILEGYGLTEACGVVALNRPGDSRIGSVGRPLPDLELRIASNDEILLRNHRLLARCPGVPEERTPISDGWIHTGDFGYLDGGFLHLTDRRDTRITLANGTPVSILRLEADLQAIPWVQRAAIVGDGRPAPCALLAIDPEAFRAWCRPPRKSPPTIDQLIGDPDVFRRVRDAVDAISARHPPAAAIGRLVLLTRPFSAETGELDSIGRLRRAFIARKFAHLLDAAST